MILTLSKSFAWAIDLVFIGFDFLKILPRFSSSQAGDSI